MKIIILSVCFSVISYLSIAQVPFYIPTSGLLAYYPFNNNVNNAYSATTDNGVVYGGVSYGPDRFGAANSCYVGNGTSGIDLPGNNFPVGNASRSVSVWYKNVLPYAGSYYMELIAWGDNISPGSRFGVVANDTSIAFESVGAGASHTYVIDSVWHDFVVTYSVAGAGTSSIKLYLDGILTSSSIIYPLSTLNTDTGNIHCIGALFLPIYNYWVAWNLSWIGSLDDIGVWNRELTPCEVWQIYSGATSSSPDSITGPSGVCAGSTITLSDTIAGGTWTSSVTTIATVDTAGVVTGIAAGAATISYIIVNPCGTFIATRVVTVDPPASAILGILNTCTTQSTTLSDTTAGGIWSISPPGIATVSASGVVTGITAGTTTVSYTASNACGATVATATVTVTANVDTIVPEIDTTICRGNDITLHAPAGYTTYAWSTGAILSSVTVSVGGAYWVAATGNCSLLLDTFNISISPVPPVSLGNDTSLCADDSILLSSPRSNGTYLWSTGSTDSSIIVTSGGIYILTVTDTDDCSASDSINVTQLAPPPFISIGPDTVLCVGDEYILTTGNIEAYWNTGVQATNIIVTDPGIYKASVTNACGSESDSVKVDFVICDIIFPSAFSPNNDGKNDIARAFGNLSRYMDYKLSIYNRWGQRIFYTTDIYDGWDGTFDGVKQDIGIYFYMISYTLEGKARMMKGDLTLVK